MFIKTHEILDAFCEMDIERLDHLLDDNRHYMNAKKFVFLKKLSSVFNRLGKEGKQRLELISGACGEEDCNLGCRGYLFKSPVSGKYISFIFEETKDGEDFEKIINCSQFKPNAAEIDENMKISMDIGIDEKADFYPTEKYLEKMELCKSAIAELTNGETEDIVISKAYLFEWLEKYKLLRLSFDLPPVLYETFLAFFDLYHYIKETGELFSYEEEAFVAVSEIDMNGAVDDDRLTEWLKKYEKLGLDLILFYVNYFEDLDSDSVPEYILPYWEYPHLKIETQHFKSIFQFLPFFNENYDRLILQNNIDPPDDEDQTGMDE